MMMTMDPRLLLGDRYGLLYYTFLANMWLHGDPDVFRSWYQRFIDNFPNEKEEHSADRFIELINNMKAGGYNNYYPVVANPQNFFLTNGVHRCAAAIALGIEQIPYSLTFANDQVNKTFFQEFLNGEERKQIEVFFEKLVASFPPDIAKVIRIRRFLHENDSIFREAAFASKTLFASVRTYQAIGPLSGKRSTELRWKEYGLEPYLKPTDTALEIGCNVGYFASELAKRVQRVDAFDIHPAYIAVAKFYNQGNNTQFYCGKFEQAAVTDSFNILICCAVHGWVNMGFGAFLKKVVSMLKDGGIILMESHEILYEKDWQRKASLLTEAFQVLKRGFIDDVDHTLYASEIREYMVLKSVARSDNLDKLIEKHGF